MSSEATTHVVTNGVILYKGNILKPQQGNRLRVIEEVDPALKSEPFVPELFDRGLPSVRPL